MNRIEYAELGDETAKPKRIQLRRAKGWRLSTATTNPNGAVKVDRTTKYGNPFRVVDYEKHTGTVWPIPGVWWIVLDPTGRPVDRDAPPKTHREAVTQAVELFEKALVAGELKVTVEDVRYDLAGKDIGCWCALSDPCHGNPLLKIANEDPS